MPEVLSAPSAEVFYHAKPRSQNRGGEAWRGKTKLFWSPGTIWPPCDKGEFLQRLSNKSVKAYAIMPIGIMGSKILSLLD